jgi:Flp pilus assembly protein TadD
VLQIIPVGVLLAERLLYFPSAGFCLAAGVAIARLLPGGEGRGEGADRRGRIPAVLILALLTALATRTVVRTLDWRSAIALWESELAKAPTDVVVNNNLAVAYTGRGEYAKAIERLEVALRVHPRYWRAWVNLGIARRWSSDLPGARAAFEKAIELAPEDTAPLLHLALMLDAQGDRAGAAALLARARRLQPEDAQLARQLGLVLLHAGRTVEARAAFTDALRLDPKDAESRRTLDGLRRP